MTSRVDICRLKGLGGCGYLEIWEYRIYVKGVRGYAQSRTSYLSARSACRAAMKIGLAAGWYVFDCTKRKKQIWPIRP